MIEKPLGGTMKKLLISMLLVAFPVTALGDSHETVEDAIKAMEETFNGSYAENDLDTYFGIYAENATLIFFGARQSLADYEEEWRAGIAAGDRIERNDMSDLRIQVLAGGDVAVATFFAETLMRTSGGEEIIWKAYETDVWQKTDGAWKVISVHYSEIPPS